MQKFYGGVLLWISMLLIITFSCTKQESNIIFKDQDGRVIRKAELRNSTGEVNYEIIGNENISAQAKELHRKAREAGELGDYAEALQLLEQAHTEAPRWPYPLYDTAYTYLLQGDSQNALKYYALVDQLAPQGYFTSKTALYILTKEANKEYPAGLYLMYMAMEWSEDTAEKKEIANQLIEKIPNFAAAWYALSTCLENETERLAAIEKGLAFDTDIETKGMLLLNKALVLYNQEKKQEAIDILGNLILSPEYTIGTREPAKYILAKFTEKDI